MTVPLQAHHAIREMVARNVPGAEITRTLGLSRNTVSKHPGMGNMPPTLPLLATRPRHSLADYET